jgi:hypothetical protein
MSTARAAAAPRAPADPSASIRIAGPGGRSTPVSEASAGDGRLTRHTAAAVKHICGESKNEKLGSIASAGLCFKKC